MHEFSYFLKREYGTAATFVHIVESQMDMSSGIDHVETIEYELARVAFLSVDVFREIHTAARSTGYPYGDMYDLSSSVILIDKHDLPLDFLLVNGDYVLIADSSGHIRKYGIKRVGDLHHPELECVHCLVEELQQETKVVR